MQRGAWLGDFVDQQPERSLQTHRNHPVLFVLLSLLLLNLYGKITASDVTQIRVTHNRCNKTLSRDGEVCVYI